MKRVEVMRFPRAAGEETTGDVELSLAEGKSLLNCVQQAFVVDQIDRYCASRRSCTECGIQRRLRWKAFLTDGARDLAGVANDLPYDNEWILDWAHIGRMLRRVDQAIVPLAYGRLTDSGSAFELWDLLVRFRHYVWVGHTGAWQQSPADLAGLLDLRENRIQR